MKTKEQLNKRWSGVLESTKEYMPESIEKYYDPKENFEGFFTEDLLDDYALLARVDYLLNQDVDSFKSNLKLSTGYLIELFEKFEQINKTNPALFASLNWLSPLLPSNFSMFKFRNLLDALASGDMSIAKKIASYMGGRPEIEKQEDDEFILSLGYSLKYAVENNTSGLQEWLPRLKAVCEDPGYTLNDFLGYYLVLEAILENNVNKTNAAFKELVLFHNKRCKKLNRDYSFYTYFYDSPDADLFVWGIGLANLCRHYGLNVTIDDPIIPDELIIPVENNTFGN